jgi:SagB-type dehydrogenase family enzyme
MERHAALYDLFWENSKLGPRTVQAFRRRLEEHAVTHDVADTLVYPRGDVPLARARDGLARLFEKRRSERAFSEAPLPLRRLGRALSEFAEGPGGRRSIPSAGALYPLEIFCLLERVSHGPGRVAVHYNPDNHSFSVIRPLPDPQAYGNALNLDAFAGEPQAVVVFVLFPDRTTAKYGERGGRFALIEVGHAAQSFALRLARERLIGCEVGGLLDDEIIRILELDGTGAQVALGYACGLPAKARSRGPSSFRKQ